VVAFSLYRSVGKDGKFNMLSIHLISGLVFGLTLRSDGLIQQEFFLDKSSGEIGRVAMAASLASCMSLLYMIG